MRIQRKQRRKRFNRKFNRKRFNNKNKIIMLSLLALLIVGSIFGYSYHHFMSTPILKYAMNEQKDHSFIKWVDFNVCYPAMEKALKYDIESHNSQTKLDWVEILSYLSAKYGGNFSKYKAKDMDKLVKKLQEGKSMQELTEHMKYYGYFKEAYSAVLHGFVGEYKIEVPDKTNPAKKVLETKYGLKVFSPIAKGYYFGDCDDFGNSRSYGFQRKHLGHDLMTNVGTPVIAVEAGTVEALGWNQYGGWRIGIRSFDGKRYYYYAHLRKNFPYNKSLSVGKKVEAGDVIGYVGMTGYSATENVNNIKTPHLHFGMQLIFDESQKEGNNEIWIDTYNIVKILQKNRSAVLKDPVTKDYNRVYHIYPSESS